MREPLAVGAFRGFRYGPVPQVLLDRLPAWLAAGRCPEGEDLQAGRVFAWGEVVLKFGGPTRRLRDLLRPSPSIRSADLFERLLPVRTPHPLLALERRGPRGVEAHLLVTERIHGRTLDELWDEDAHARAAFADFLAQLHERDVFHGDLHVRNCLWSGEEWVLVDLESLRHPLRRLRKRWLVVATWTRIAWDLGRPADLRALFERFVARLGRGLDADRLWRTIERRAAELEARRGPAREVLARLRAAGPSPRP